MKKQEKLQDAIGMVGNDLIQKAGNYRRKTAKIVLKWLTPAVAAVLVMGIVCGSLLWPRDPGLDLSGDPVATPDHPVDKEPAHNIGVSKVLAAADYPDAASYLKEEEWEEWQNQRSDRNKYAKQGGNIDSFLQKSMAGILSTNQRENKIYSPLNVYIALAMLTEVTEGESRQQILDLLGVPDVATLREKCRALWKANYRDDGVLTSILASSVWLDDVLTINQDTVERLAKNYYASSYRGDLGSEEMNELLKTWLDEQTGGLLKDQIKDLQMSPDTVLALATTIYYRAKWADEFWQTQTREKTFYAPDEEVKCLFMYKNYEGGYLKGENYQVVYQRMSNSGNMYFILPDEGVDPQNLLKDPKIAEIVSGGGDYSEYEIDFSVPRFDISSQIKLNEALKELGVQNVFDSESAEFNLEFVEEELPLYLSKVQHDARVKINEEGCEAAAYTVEQLDGEAAPGTKLPKVQVKADRPFIFAITSEYDLPLFVGTVYQP